MENVRQGSFETLVFTPAGSADATLAIAGCRAGATGILNLELLSNPAQYQAQLEALARYSGTSGFGVKLDMLDTATEEMLGEFIQSGLGYLILDAAAVDSNSLFLPRLMKLGVQVFAEITSTEHDVGELQASVSGLLLKGNESGGMVGEDSSFILCQRWQQRCNIPLYIRGGVTPDVAAAVMALGFKGCVLDSQLLLLAESPLRESLAPVIAKLVGNETVAAGDGERGGYFRLLQRPGNRAAKKLLEQAVHCGADELRELVVDKIDWSDPAKGILPLGQDVGIAGRWAERYGRIANVIEAIKVALDQNLVIASGQQALSSGSPLARAFGTEFPIVQGPMTRVSDCAAFASAVANNGALPMLALSLVKGDALEQMLEETRLELADRPWGIGLLGFAPRELLDHQVETSLKFRPDYAIIAGGRPDQAASLEASGIPSFLHVPSPNLLSLFIQDGARRFIFEGRECGGHIGPLSSFTLWSSVIDCLLPELDKNPTLADELMLLFAGGIHDAASSMALQVLLAPLTQRGVKVGMLMGSAYLFTEEIVSSNAVVPGFQREAIDCHHTVSLESGPGHASRCAYTDFARYFYAERRDLLSSDQPPDEVRGQLDDLILGRLRIASKGLTRDGESGSLIALEEKVQHDDGMYMLGQVATLRNGVTTIADLHSEVSEVAGNQLVEALQNRVDEALEQVESLDIAMVGMASLFPEGNTTETYWCNILNKVDAISEIPAHRWDWRLYFDEDRYAKDKIYSRWGGFLEDLPFDPTDFGMPPKSLTSVDPMQLMALEVARRTLVDAGCDGDDADLSRTSVILGASGGAGDVGMQYGLRAELPRFNGTLPAEISDQLPQWSEDSFAGILINVVAGRIANRLNLGGVNYTTDAACASSLAAIYQGVSELVLGHSDMVLSGGVDTVQGPFGYLCFSQTQALSPRGRCRTFDADADGIAISEGIAMIAIKRLEDAERDGDRIYCVIRGVGGSSDGKAKGLTAPLPAGQLRAMRAAYRQAGYGPESVGLFEAHGTGTVAGDTAELESTTSLALSGGAPPHSAVVGSVKTNIGHTKAAAGVAGLIKVAMSLYYKVLPPHRGVETPNKVLVDDSCPLYLLEDARPWLRRQQTPRRASVSAFGFGGTNFHVTVEEYRGEYRPWMASPAMSNWPAELFLWSGEDTAAIQAQLSFLADQLAEGVDLELRDISRAVINALGDGTCTAYLVARNLDELATKLPVLAKALEKPEMNLPPGLGIARRGPGRPGKVAFLFSGQGSQYADMLRELAVYMPTCRQTIEEADANLFAAFQSRFGEGASLGQFIFPRGAYSPEEKRAATKALTSTDVAQPALGAVSTALHRLLSEFGVEADMMGGHSYGEFTALHAAGVFDFEQLMALSEARGRLIVDCAKEAGSELGTMAALPVEREKVEAVISRFEDVVVANHNAPRQVIISGSTSGIEAAVAAFAEQDIEARIIPVAAAFHSEYVRPAQRGLTGVINQIEWNPPLLPVYSNTTGADHGADPDKLKATMIEHLVKPVEFQSQIESMYGDGATTFVELGPKAVLTGLVNQILGERPHTALALDEVGGMVGLLSALGELVGAGVSVDIQKLFSGRDCMEVALEDLSAAGRSMEPSKHSWMINGSGVRKRDEPVRTVGVTVDAVSSPLLQPSTSIVAAAPAEQNVAAAPPQISRVSGSTVTSSAGQEREAIPMGDYQPLNNQPPPVMREYFETMKQFLHTQEAVMTSYLGGTAGARSPRLQQRPALLSPESAPQPQQASLVQTAPAAPTAMPAAPAPIPAAAPVIPQQSPPPPTAPEPASSAAAPAAAEEVLDRDAMADKLYTVIEDTTGYPKDMVAPDQNLEGDLGIDSIKRVEIVGNFLQQMPSGFADAIGDGRKELVAAPTLNDMLAILAAVDMGAAAGEVANPFKQAGTDTSTAHARRLSRHIICTQPESIVQDALQHTPTAPVLILKDEGGVAEALSALLKEGGCDTRLMTARSLLDMDPAEIVSQFDIIGGVISLVSLDAAWLEPDASEAEFEQQLLLNEQAFFTLLTVAIDHMEENACMMSVSALGGDFLHGPQAGPASGLSLQGGAVGLLKSLQEECPQFRYRAVDFDPGLDVPAKADALLQEFGLCGGRVEVGYPGGNRVVFHTVEEEHGKEFFASPLSSSSLVILATGGARGITAEVLRPFGRAGNTLILTGRTELCDEDESTSKLAGAEDLRQYFFTEVRSGRIEMTPLQVQKHVAGIMAQREMRQNIEGFRQAGATVAYYSVDVSNRAAMADFIEQLYTEFGEINGVIHGAGILEDKKVRDKTAKSWMRVVGVKLMGLLWLQQLIRPEMLNFFTVFSSVAGRYGNSGQSDYATANELMSRVCQQLQGRWGDDVLVRSFCWGPWGPTRYGSGMVTPEVEAKFVEKGVALVTAAQGAQHFVDELCSSPGAVEVVSGTGPWEEHEAELGAFKRKSPAGEVDCGPLLGMGRVTLDAKGEQTIEFRLDDRHEYLQEHLIDGIPVLPAAVAMNIMSEAAATLWPDWTVTEVHQSRLMKGIELNQGVIDLSLVVSPAPYGDAAGFEVPVKLFSGGETKTLHYRAVVRLEHSVGTSPLHKPGDYRDRSITADFAYREWLFHGPRFQVIESINGMSEAGARCSIVTSRPEEWLSGVTGGSNWLFDPGLVDAAAQMGLIWGRRYLGKSALPAKFERVVRYTDSMPEQVEMIFEITDDSNDFRIVADVYFCDRQGKVYLAIHGLECIASEELNRLGGTATEMRQKGALG